MKIIILCLLFLSFASICSADTISNLIGKYSNKWNVPTTTVTAVIKCESSFDPKAVGDSGDSLGLVQIDRKYHPEVTEKEAFDPDFSVNYLAYYLSIDKGNLWSCYRDLGFDNVKKLK